jgi:hypothetical protein
LLLAYISRLIASIATRPETGMAILTQRSHGIRGILLPILCCGFWLMGFPTTGLLGAEPAGDRLNGNEATAAESLSFETHIRPILKAQCFDCHGDSDKIEAGLDLRLVRLLSQGGDSGQAIVAGDHAKSLLYERIQAKEMPPGEKKLSETEIALIGQWIDQGAQTLKPEPETVSVISEAERNFWSFQPIRAPAVPTVADTDLVRTPIDAFLLAKLTEQGQSFSPEADRATLCRRLYFDLIGLPPTPGEIEAFVTDDSPQAYEQLVDRLLAMPQYGERWGRHWLDVAGYADSDGYSPLDPVRAHAYKYRDYVIRAFNDDKPWNEFIVEQLAGDELLKPPYANHLKEDLSKLIATGYLRMGPDGTGDANVDQPLARNDVVVETIKIVSTSLLGLTVGCAQCHNHRYDPILQTDYYSFRALFEPAYDWKNWRSSKSRLVSTLTAAEKKQSAEIDVELRKIAGERLAELNPKIDELFEIELAKIPTAVHELARSAKGVSPTKRTPAQEQLIRKYPKLYVTMKSVETWDKAWYDDWTKRYTERSARAAANRPQEEFIRALTETPGKFSPTLLFYRGDHNQGQQEVPPSELTVLKSPTDAPLPKNDPAVASTGRRLAYARQLTDGKHPLVARVLVNRFWLHHFGHGIVGTPGDFGALGEQPTHPELLDWLANDFMRGGWRLKRLHKTLLLSTAFRQSSARTERLDAVDPDNRWLGRMSVRRLEAETLRDAVLAVSGKLNPKMYGVAVPVAPDESGQVVLGIDTRDGVGRFKGPPKSVGDEAFRRSVYIQNRRSLPLGMLEAFDAPEMSPNCEQRNNSTVTPQALLLMNNRFVLEQSEFFAKRLMSAAGPELPAQLWLGWHSAFGRAPTDEQLAAATEFVAMQTEAFRTAATDAPQPSKTKTKAAPPSPQLRALTSYCHSLFSSNGFLYID